MSILFDNINKLCGEKGVSIHRLAKEVGISSGNLYDLKYGTKRALSLPATQRIADYFGVPIERLLVGEDLDVPVVFDAFMEEIRDRAEMKMLFKAARDATPEQIKAVVNLLESMKGDK